VDWSVTTNFVLNFLFCVKNTNIPIYKHTFNGSSCLPFLKLKIWKQGIKAKLVFITFGFTACITNAVTNQRKSCTWFRYFLLVNCHSYWYHVQFRNMKVLVLADKEENSRNHSKIHYVISTWILQLLMNFHCTSFSMYRCTYYWDK